MRTGILHYSLPAHLTVFYYNSCMIRGELFERDWIATGLTGDCKRRPSFYQMQTNLLYLVRYSHTINNKNYDFKKLK